MCLIKSLYINIPANRSLRDIIEDTAIDKKAKLKRIKSLEDSILDHIVCTLMYYRQDKGPNLIKKVLEKVTDVASCRLVSMSLQQSNVEGVVTDDSIVFEFSAADTVRCFDAMPEYCKAIATYVLDHIDEKSGLSGDSPYSVDDFIVIMHTVLCEMLHKKDYYSSAREFVASSANLADLIKVEANVDNAVMLMSSKATYECIAKAIEQTPLYKQSNVNS